MKLPVAKPSNRGITLLETVMVLLLLFVLAEIFLATLAAARVKRNGITCATSLKQTALAFHIWAGDNSDKYPMAIAVTNGGAMEPVLEGNATPVFQVMSNELSSPKVLVCPQDTAHPYATHFGPALTGRNISYFVNPDAAPANPQDLLVGDDNFQVGGVPVKSGLLVTWSTTPIAWTTNRHKFRGNVALADGSVESLSPFELTNRLHSTNTLRFAIP